MKKTKTLTSLLVTGALVLAGCGENSENASSGDTPAAGNGIDRAFVAEMIPHHESALEMAKIAQQRGDSEFVKRLADDIVRTQSEEIATLRREDDQLAEAGVKKGKLGVPAHMMGMGEDVEQLKAVTPFDEPFIKMMVPHHRGAIEMAKVELAKGKDPELKALAQEIIDAQKREIDEMTAHLSKASSGPDPDSGGRADVAPNSGREAESSAGRRGRTTALEAAANGTGPRDLTASASE